MKTLLKNLRLLLFMSTVSLLASSCTTLSKEDCASMNWYEKGNSDGMKGESSNVFNKYQKTCQKHGITTNREDYKKGRDVGLKYFCTTESGEDYGRKGGIYSGVCPPTLEAQFLKGYVIGQREYEIEQRELALKKRQEELEEREAKLSEQEATLIQSNSRQCKFDSDCTIESDCSFNKCERTGVACTFDSDCDIKGDCDSSGSVRQCSYN